MKRVIFTLTAMVIMVSVLEAQSYFDKNWKKCNKESAHFVIEKGTIGATEHIVRTISKEGFSKSYSIYKTNDFKNGEMVRFNENGDTVAVENYLKGKLNGEYKRWRQNGDLYKKATYRAGKEDGISEYFFPNGQLSARYRVVKGNQKEGEYWNADGSKVLDPNTANVSPTFMGKDRNSFGKWVTDRLIYPVECKKLSIEGTVEVSFRVGVNGKLEDVNVIKSPHYLLSAEALRIIGESPDWTPGISHNQVIATRYTIPVIFKLSSSK